MALPVRRSSSPTSVRPRSSDPLSGFGDLEGRMSQLLESIWEDRIPDPALFTPPVDIEETDDAWVVEAEVPGVKREHVDVDVRGNELVVTGEIKERERKGILRRRTRRVGEFELRVTLPGEVDTDNVDAKLRDGILTVRVPKPEQSRPRRVEVGQG